MPPADPGLLRRDPAKALAISIEQARIALAANHAPDTACAQTFLEALARLIHQALADDRGDYAFQAMVMRHEVPEIQEYASLSAHAAADRRRVHVLVDAFAHPGKLRRMEPDRLRAALAGLHAHASTGSWRELGEAARRALDESGAVPSLTQALRRLVNEPGLRRLQRIDALAAHERVRRYRRLWEQYAPRSGTQAAREQGRRAQGRGAAVEALSVLALERWAKALEVRDPGAAYRVVSSLRVPASFPGDRSRAKTEWDAVLLRTPPGSEEGAGWDLCLLVEAKATPDAAATDFPRLQRGLHLLSRAENGVDYSFETGQGGVLLRGGSLRSLASREQGLEQIVLYCSNAEAERDPRILGASSRMQLLSAPASLDYAQAWMTDPAQTTLQDLTPVWRMLLDSDSWYAVRHQYPTLRTVRELMVHIADLEAAIRLQAHDA